MRKLQQLSILFSLVAALYLPCSQIVAQNKVDGLETGSLQDQFNFLVTKSNRYEQYRVVPTTWLNTFWSHVSDTLQQQQSKISADQQTMNEQLAQIKTLNNSAESLNTQIAELDKTKNSMNLLGLSVNKITYNSIMWLLIAGLLGGLVTYIMRFQNANTVTKKTIARNVGLQEELDNQRKRMLEKEQVLRRQLQDEVNKNNALLKKLGEDEDA